MYEFTQMKGKYGAEVPSEADVRCTRDAGEWELLLTGLCLCKWEFGITALWL